MTRIRTFASTSFAFALASLAIACSGAGPANLDGEDDALAQRAHAAAGDKDEPETAGHVTTTPPNGQSADAPKPNPHADADAGSAPDAAPPPPEAKDNPGEMFVHLHGNKPEWFAVWIPGDVKLRNGQEDPPASVLQKAVVHGLWPPPATFTAQNGAVYHLLTNGQAGSTDIYPYYSENYSPLVVELDGEATKLSTPTDGAHFDIVGDGKARETSWPTNGSKVAFLALDKNGNGVIDGVSELFGDASGAGNGFEALRAYDANQDGVIDAKDPVWRELRLWNDANADGKTDDGELTDASSKLRSIAVAYEARTERLDTWGNEIRQLGTAQSKTNGAVRVVDVWFAPTTR